MDGRAGGLVGEDDILQYTAQIDRLVERIDQLIESQQQGGNTQTLVHKTEGVTPWVSAAVTACFMTYFALILVSVWAFFQINNLWAWKDVHAAKIAVLEAKHAAGSGR